MTGFAKQEDVPRLREIWKACFGDSDSYLDFYYANGFPHFQTMVDRQGKDITSMLTVVPAEYLLSGNRYPAAYLYAVATDPPWQGKGLASKLLRDTHDYLKNNGVTAAMLFPASDSLYDFYGRSGYRAVFSIREWDGCLEPGPRYGTLSRCEEEVFLLQSGRLLDQQKYGMRFSPEALRYFYRECFATGGQVLQVEENHALQGYAVCYKIKEVLHIKETSLSPEQLARYASALMERFHAAKLTARLPAEPGQPAKRHGMLCVLNETESLWPEDSFGYMNLVLD